MNRAAALPSESAVGDDLRRCLERVLPGGEVAEVLARLETAKVAALAEFAAGAGHEINNPVAVISGRAEMLLRGESDAERRRMLRQIGAQALRIRDMIGDLMLFARPPQPVCERLDLAETVRSVVARFADELPPAVTVSLQADEPVPIRADRTQLCVAVECLLRNSLEAIEGRSPPGRIEIECRTADSDQRQGLLVIRDNGRGLSEADREHLFDPFYSGRQAGRGLGFGLCKCWRIVTLHGGRIEVESSAEGGTSFRVFWPAADEPPAG